MYIITPIDHMSHDISYFSGPRTSGAAKAKILRVYSNEIPNGIMDISSAMVSLVYTSHTASIKWRAKSYQMGLILKKVFTVSALFNKYDQILGG